MVWGPCLHFDGFSSRKLFLKMVVEAGEMDTRYVTVWNKVRRRMVSAMAYKRAQRVQADT